MPYITDHKKKFQDLQNFLDERSRLRRWANGGNSILLSCPPNEEQLYIEKARELYKDEATFIDIGRLFVEFIDQEGWDSFKEYYREFRSTPHIVFKSDDENTDLFDLIINAIEKACEEDRIPFLIRTGCLYGTGIENITIMENSVVMRLKKPLVILYPSKVSDENLYFLNFKPASKYRCILIK